MAKILVVDDSMSIVKLISSRLQQAGHQIVASGSDGEQGVRLFQQHSPDVTLLDVTMPNKDGRQCLTEIMKASPKAKVIMLSSVADESVIQECIKLGAKIFVNKATLPQRGSIESRVEEVLKLAA